MSIGHSLSLSDMLLVDGFKEAFGSGNKALINKYLWENGLDTSMGVDEIICQHRNLRGNIVNCLRWEAHERCDSEWLQSEGCSWEAKVEACDLELRIQLKTMGRNYNNTGEIINMLEKHRGNGA
jgi:hypothetical protein